jgi:predicted O-linked N-acetylglucosamine transferase (SPINDLY family)
MGANSQVNKRQLLMALCELIGKPSQFYREGEKRSIEAERFIFAPRVSSEDYLARFKVADLFGDTLPFGGGTTTRDALWMGLPVLTTLGESFAGRMSASILHAAGAQEFIRECRPIHQQSH